MGEPIRRTHIRLSSYVPVKLSSEKSVSDKNGRRCPGARVWKSAVFFPVRVRISPGGQVFVTAVSAEANCFLNLCLAESGMEKDTLQPNLPVIRCPEFRIN